MSLLLQVFDCMLLFRYTISHIVQIHTTIPQTKLTATTHAKKQQPVPATQDPHGTNPPATQHPPHLPPYVKPKQSTQQGTPFQSLSPAVDTSSPAPSPAQSASA